MRPHLGVTSAAVFIVTLAAVACLDTSSPNLDLPNEVVAIRMQPTSASVPLGGHVSFQAVAVDNSGDPVSGQSVTWSSQDTTVAVVDANGNVSTKKIGSTQIVASGDSKVGTASVNVMPPAVASVQLTPSSADILVGDVLQLVATPRDADGNALTGRTITWSSSNQAVATVSSSGSVSGVAQGTAVITATSEGVSSTSDITVSPLEPDTVVVSPSSVSIQPKQTAQLTANVRNSQGQTMTTTVSWLSGDPTLASVSGSGLVTGLSSGTTTVTASAGKKKTKVKVVVAQSVAASVTVSPSSISLTQGGTQQLQATVKDDSGNVLTGSIITWSSNDTSAATVSSTGMVTARGAGNATITALSSGVSGTASVAVQALAAPVASVSMSPTSASLVTGDTITFTATPRDSTGTALGGRTITWASSNTSVAKVSGTGLVTAVAVGSASITATSEGKIGTAGVTVSAPPVASVAVSPHSASVVTNGTVQLSVTLRDANGNILTGRTVTWSSSDSSTATVNGTGLVTGATPGTAEVYATSEGHSDSSTVTVTAPAAATVSVAPNSATLRVGNTSQFAATVRDASGNVLTGLTVTWSSSATATATVSASGLVTAVAPGSATITATSEGKSGTSAISVTLVPVSTVTVTPKNDTLAVGANAQLSATLKDSAGNVLTGRTITWGTSSASVATVTSSGMVTGVAGGNATITATSEGKSGTSAVVVDAPAPPPPTTHAGWYVAPNGSSGASGSASAPWDLATALSGAGGRIQPGDTVWLRAGTYGSGEGNSDYHATLNGTASAPIIVRQYPGERATVNGDIAVDGSYTWYWGFELKNTNTSTQDIQGINSHCPGCRFINMVVHDHSGDGFGLWSEGPNQVAYGNIIYNNGFHGSTSTSYGHGIYTQNQTGTKLLQDNVLFNQFGYGIHVYGSGNAYLNNFTVDGNVSFNSGVGDGMNYTLGGGSPLINLVVNGNMAYYNPDRMGNSFRIGYNFGTTNTNGTMTNNYIVGTTFVSQWTSGFTFTGNTVVNSSGLVVLVDQDVPTNSTWDNNTYSGAASTPFSALNIGYSFSQWRSTFGWDAHSTLSSSPPPNHIVVEPNAYEPGRANIVVYNWTGAGSVTVDLSGALNIGDHFVVVNAQNFYGTPVMSGVYGGPISLPISTVSPPAAIGGQSMPATSTQFQTYVVLKQ
ncbi:MAG TPA: Ig-like domain-containing protein [Gemmatimonadaceae bacterium]|nr:Ig-like domain-containing protein [Gemmatimonadaceae bacterium]